MAHPAQQQFCRRVAALYPDFFRQGRVLDVGSQDINGSNRELFGPGVQYTGIDLGPGKGVDVVAHCIAYYLNHWDGVPFDVVISTEALEHDKKWEQTLNAMHEMLRPGGLLVMTCAGPGRPEHGTTRTEAWCSPHTTDYYRNLSCEEIQSALPPALFSESSIGYVPAPVCDTHFWGIKAA